MPAKAEAASEKLRYQRPQDWRGAFLGNEDTRREVSIRGLLGDDSYPGPGDSPVLWTVNVTIAHLTPAKSIYFGKATPPTQKVADGQDRAEVKIEVGHARGSKAPSQTCTIKCEIAHLDGLAAAFTAALMIARRDGIIPIARGTKPWNVGKMGQRGSPA